RISTGELWQKRLMVAGFEKTFEIGRQFRNEGMDSEHLQDYTQMEFYWAYADYEKGMEFVEEMYKYVIKKSFGTLKFKIRGFDIDFSKKWEKYDYQSTIAKYTGVNIEEASLLEIEKVLQKLKIDYDKNGFNITRAIDNLWKHCRKNIVGPGFLINVPIIMEPLAKRMEKSPKLVQRFQVILAGSEMGKGYSELNDPIDQAERFTEQQKLRDKGDEEAQRYDKDFVEALEHGMPPTCGFGVSERLFSFLMDKPMRECQIFPLMKPENSKGAGSKKNKETEIAVVIIDKSAKLGPWQEMNTIAHLNASFAARHGKSLFVQDAIKTKDNKEIKLNIKDAIMIKETNNKSDLLELINIAKEKELEVVEFIRDMITTSDDKKIIEKTANTKWEDIDYLGVLVFGKKSVVEKMTDKFKLWKN
ncbi:MAG: DUF2000 family protein, partial [Candidatus Staskawiczbacteria bacterium]|nr:DUF2000 family protein [Candidatus Staskawiczbacteria bacterium]